jgi:Holliday junction resolvase RusA-like endonuclease
MTVIHRITPMGKPRMTQADKWHKRKVTSAYWRFKMECQLIKISVPDMCDIKFYIPMPKSWSKKKRSEMNYKPHQQKPDIDNLVKAVLDAVLEDDSHVHTVHASKVWVDTETGGISIEEIK